MSQANARVGIVMGSRSDLEVMKKAAETLKSLEIPCEICISSAHRTPDWCAEYAETAEERGSKSSLQVLALQRPSPDALPRKLGCLF